MADGSTQSMACFINCLLHLIHYRIFLIKEIKYIEKYLKLIYDQSN